MKVLICGATGFMGQNIAQHFLKLPEFEVFGTARIEGKIPSDLHIPGDHLYSVDLTKQEQVNMLLGDIKPDIIIQAAANTSGSKDITQRPYIHVTDNAVMNSWLLKAAFDNYVKHFIFLSCAVMYQPGNLSRKESDYSESDPLVPAYFGVGWTKVYIEKQCEFFAGLGRTKHTVIRHSNTYGPYDKYDLERSHVVGATIRKVMDAQDGETISVWGTGLETARDLLYVQDVVDFIEAVIQGPRAQTNSFDLVNVGYGRAITVKEIVETVVKLSGKNLKIVYDATKPSIPTKLTLDWSKANADYGWHPQHSFIEGVTKTLEWYANYYEEFL